VVVPHGLHVKGIPHCLRSSVIRIADVFVVQLAEEFLFRWDRCFFKPSETVHVFVGVYTLLFEQILLFLGVMHCY
jgi:hypothetical protein